MLTLAMVLCAAGVVQAASIAVSDASFESHQVANYQYSPQLSGYLPGWTFGPGTGLTPGNTDFNSPSNIPDGTQVAFLQGDGSNVSQAIDGFAAFTTYTVNLFIGTRFANGGYDGNADVGVSIDGTQIGQTTGLSSSTYFSEYSYSFTVYNTPGTHSLSIFNISAPGDHTAFVDNVSIESVAPEPATFALFGIAILGLGVRFARTRRTMSY